MISVFSPCMYFQAGIHEMLAELNIIKGIKVRINRIKTINCNIESLISNSYLFIIDELGLNSDLLNYFFEIKSKLKTCKIILISRRISVRSQVMVILKNMVFDIILHPSELISHIITAYQNYHSKTDAGMLSELKSSLPTGWSEYKLTKREYQILPYLITGKNNTYISRRMNISPKTVSNHRRSIYLKFNANGISSFYHRMKQESVNHI